MFIETASTDKNFHQMNLQNVKVTLYKEIIISSNKFNDTPPITIPRNYHSSTPKTHFFSAFIGQITLQQQQFLLFVKTAKLVLFSNQVCTINKHDIFSICKTVCIPVEYQKQSSELDSLIYSISQALNFGIFFSFTYDLTQPLSKQKQQSKLISKFNWAQNLQLNINMSPKWKISYIQGYVGKFSIYLQGNKFKFVLVSRRSTKMAGTRFNARGINSDGYVGNFSQTQQIIEFQNFIFSHVQIRGSIPFYWRQVGIKKNIQILGSYEQNKKVFTNYLRKLIKKYSSIVIVNLLSVKKGQGKLLSSFQHLIKNLDKQMNKFICYSHYDVYVNCQGNYQLSNTFITNVLGSKIKQFGFTCIDRQTGNILKRQKGVFRTNCLDCLDRTNVIQSKITAYVMLFQFQHLNIQLNNMAKSKLSNQLGLFEQVSNPLVSMFRNIWANNSDYISMHYAGTGSTHSSVTRTGQRTVQTMIDHGVKSIKRWLREQMGYDLSKQTILCIILGQQRSQSKSRNEQMINF